MTETFCNEPLQNMCLLYGLFGGLIGSLCLGWLCFPTLPQEVRLGIVDLQTLVSIQSEQMAKNLGEDLATFAKQHNLILLIREAIVGGEISDQTTAFLDWLARRHEPGAKHQGNSHTGDK